MSRVVEIIPARGGSKRIPENIMGNDIFLFDFFSGEPLSEIGFYKDQIDELIVKYRALINSYGVGQYVVKFDAIFDGNEFYTLGIGIDPPQILIQYFHDYSQDFCDYYLGHYCTC